jgi:hypothetical protein
MRASSLALAVAMAVGLFACSPAPTQLIVVVDTDLAIPGELDEVRISVTSDRGAMGSERQPLASPALLPLTLSLVAEGEDLGPVEVVAEGRLDGVLVVSRLARAMLVRGETRMLRLHLVADCVGVDCGADESCGETGCGPIDVVAPPWPGSPPRLSDPDAGMDGGPRPPDAAIDVGPLPDVGRIDAGPLPADAGADAPLPDAWVGCTTAADCDDGLDCTTDQCMDGRCVQVPDDTRCDDDEECTSNRCSVGVGCTFDPVDAACDDGIFCNGFDRCVGGACTMHTGDPCASPTVCDEGARRCAGCRTVADCPGPTTGSWGACSYADGCDESATRTRTDRTYECVSGACRPTDTDVTEPCTRDTDGTSCGVGSCGSYGACSYSSTCDESASQTRTCTDLACAAGVCRSTNRDETRACTRDTDGTMCMASSCGAYGACDYGGTCDESASQTRSCNDYACVTGSCAATARTETNPCTRSTTGTSCGMPTCGAWGACDYADACDESATQTRTCMDPTCAGGSCGAGGMRTEMQACTRDTDGTSCGTARTCVAAVCTSCAPSLTGSHGTGSNYFTVVTGAGNQLRFTEYMPMSTGSITASGAVTFSGSYTAPLCIWSVQASGNTLRFTDWGGTDMGMVTMSGATASGMVAPACTPSPYGCFPPCLSRVTTSGSSLVLTYGDGTMGTITFGCP